MLALTGDSGTATALEREPRFRVSTGDESGNRRPAYRQKGLRREEVNIQSYGDGSLID